MVFGLFLNWLESSKGFRKASSLDRTETKPTANVGPQEDNIRGQTSEVRHQIHSVTSDL